MKKRKEGGFAITALLYGLSILGFTIVAITISIMQSKRAATVELTKAIEEELNEYGKTTQAITGTGTYNYAVSRGNDGYYLIELYGGGGDGDYTSGMIYLTSSMQYEINIGNGDSTMKYGGETIMLAAGKNSTEKSKIKGMAKYNDIYKDSSQPTMFFNGQVKEKVYSELTGKVTINKISEKFPINRANELFLQGGYLEIIGGKNHMWDSGPEATIVKVPKVVLDGEASYPAFKDLVEEGTKIKITEAYALSDVYVSEEKMSGWFGYRGANYDDFYIKYNGERLSMEVNSWYSDWWCKGWWPWWFGSSNCTKVSIKVQPDPTLDGFEFQMFNPYSEKTLKDGNYYLSLASITTSYSAKDWSWWDKRKEENMYQINLSNFLTSQYITDSLSDNYIEDDDNASKLVLLSKDKNGNRTFGRKIYPTKTVSNLSQRWYIEQVKNGEEVDYFVISDINDHKLVELDSSTCSKASEKQEEINQSNVINGKYKNSGTNGLETIESPNTAEINQQWDIIEAGLGLWYIKSNVCGTDDPRFVKCTNSGCTLTNNVEKASLFSILNADI